jgi:hypothetical protein
VAAQARGRRLSVPGLTAATGIALLALVVVLIAPGIRDAQVAQVHNATVADAYYIAAESDGNAASVGGSVMASALSGTPACPAGQLPWIAVSHPPPPGPQPGTGAASAEAAFRRANPTITEFTMYPFGGRQPVQGDGGHGPVWIVAGDETFIAQAPGRSGDPNKWFAFPATFMGCRTPPPGSLRSTGGR